MPPSWVVVSQRQTSINNNGQFEDAMLVTFRTNDGVTATVTVPLSQYTDAYVKSLIDARAQAIGSVHALTSATSVTPSASTDS